MRLEAPLCKCLPAYLPALTARTGSLDRLGHRGSSGPVSCDGGRARSLCDRQMMSVNVWMPYT